MKSVLHVALIAPNGYNNKPFMDAFLANGFTSYHCYDYQLETFSSGHAVMRQKLINLAQQTKPDLIFLHVQNSEALDLETYKTLSSIGFTVLYTFDCRTKEQTKWMYDLAPYVGLICFSNKEDVDECKINRWQNNTMVLQSSCDMEAYKFWEKRKDGYYEIHPKEIIHDIIFVGGNYVNTNLNFPLAQERADMVEFLGKSYPESFRAFGMGWKEGSLVNAKTETAIYQGCKIAISHNNFDKELYTSDRLWRIMASGGFCLTKHFKGIETMFDRGVHLDWWYTLPDLKDKIDYYLDKPFLREGIALAGMLHVRTMHRWTDRIAEMMVEVDKNKPKDIPCRDVHRVRGIIPISEEHIGVCDCGKILFKWELCGCGSQEYQIRAEQNI
jgi:hypothetical protein